MGPKSYRVWQNNANYTAITPFKVIHGRQFWYQWKSPYATSYLLVINSNLPRILHRIQVMADY